MIQLNDDDVLSRLRDFENPFVERKVGSDIKDCLKTAVAFANCLPIGTPGVLFVPVYNNGTVQRDQNLEDLQGTISKMIGRAYPLIAFVPRLLGTKPDQFLAVQIWGSPDRPHFAGKSYIRDGAATQGSIGVNAEFMQYCAALQ